MIAALPMVLSYLQQQRAQKQAQAQARQQAQSDILQRSASQLGAPSTAGVDAAQFQASQRDDKRRPFAELLMKLAQSSYGGGKQGGGGGAYG